ncbi:hypothetical protein VTL71DRAFT_4998 [Oculimacula yallundae]|uniref:Uncharacterized protein n=1 Tax=Oculimacula yallundae TaxID=86028 RepID=A0ABR4BZW6_9HELO
MSIGRITNSLAAATVENSLSLFQFNFDFTYKKTAPPVEFYPVGRALSAHRRQSAENGAAHRTARKLGWLFEQLVPDTPRLLKAYGLRVSEILQQPGINPTGSAADGPFRDFVGADCTSLWAAATSGIAALGVHLLACVLARAWDAQTATAIWVELVKSRQLEILGKLGQGHVVSETSVAAARQDFLRSELAGWDASARSWLTQADKAFAAKRDQFLLIVKNISLSTGENPDPYTNVIATWVLAMSTMERHLQGMSQEVSDGATLFAISAWHLYPDIAHYGSGAKHIKFSDPLFEEQATMTLGLTEFAASKDTRGTHWSLCLSHLRYYGVPVRVESVEDRTRVTSFQLLIIVLGSVLESWHVLPQDRHDAIRWISDLWAYLKRTAPFDPEEMHINSQTRWLAVLGRTAQSFVNATDIAREQYEDYLDHGEHWGRHCLMDEESLYKPAYSIRPFFGLCNPMVMQALQEPLDVDAGVTYLRVLATRIGLSDDEGIICYTEIKGDKGYYEYCTATPHLDSAKQSKHARWIKMAQIPENLRGRDLDCYHVSHEGSNHSTNIDDVDLDARSAMVVANGEQCFHLEKGSLSEIAHPHSFNSTNPLMILFWENDPSLYTTKVAGKNCARVDSNDTTPCSCLSPSIPSHVPGQEEDYQEDMDVTFSKIAGTNFDTGRERNCSLELFVRKTSGRKAQSPQYKIIEATTENVKPSIGSQWLNSNLPHSTRLWDYIERCGNPDDDSKLGIAESTVTPTGLDWRISHGRAAKLISNHIMSPPSRDWIRSLELVGAVYEIYKHLPGATISLKVLEYPISHARWGKRLYISNVQNSGTGGCREIVQTMGREEIFSCIAMMQTGSSDIEPKDLTEVMAISADNSIFVAGVLLSDPHMMVDTTSIRHIVGNVGYPGLNLMISPAGNLAIRPPKNEIRNVSRSNYDYNRTDKFEGTSLHLTFTGQRFPLISTDVNDIDQGIFHLQTVVSLWDAGKHVADLNILDVHRKEFSRVQMLCSCAVPLVRMEGLRMTCLDLWDDIIFPPRRQAMMRSKGNWAARLAAAAIFIQQGREHSVAFLPEGTVCWKCVALFFQGPDGAINWPDLLVD